ncbi:MAG: peptidylprolyl isomerase [Betaproteobacteria bacterium]|nr:peptidylprolyl isomerase [Betaproteobacteria bacterium]
MIIAKDTVVSIEYELCDSAGKVLEKSREPVSYLHGGYQSMFPLVEEALAGRAQGETCSVSLEPEDAFGEYDAELVRVEPRNLFPGNITVGMQFEGRPEGTEHATIYTVTNITEEKVVVDGNHPLAGQKLVFSCTVTGVRAASQDEVSHGHAHGPHGHHHHD